MYTCQTLEKVEIIDLHRVFTYAFSDYQVSTDMSLEMFECLLKRNGYAPEASVGTIKDGMLVGFFLNGIRRHGGMLTAYDSGTAVVPEHRRKGLTSAMFAYAKQLLKSMGVEKCLLEVIKTNTSALELYIKQGFEVLRDLECFVLDGRYDHQPTGYEVIPLALPDADDWSVFRRFWDFEPSWQNSVDSVTAVPNRFCFCAVKVCDTFVGYGIVDKETGDVPQIAVDREYRGKGVGRSIVAYLTANTKSGRMKMINVDSRCVSALGFLKSLGANPFVSQHEMSMDI